VSSAELVNDNGLFIAIQVQLHEGDLAKQCPGTRWHGASNTWRVPVSWTACLALRGVFGQGLAVGPLLAAWAEKEWTERIGPLTQLRLMEDLALQGPTAEKLWPLQRVACYAMALAERYGNFDEMGGGKSASTLAAMKLAIAMHGPDEVYPALIVCPNKVRRTWRNEAARVWPELQLEVMPKGKVAQRKVLDKVKEGLVDVVVTNWESLAGLSRLEPFGNIEMSEKEKTPGPLNEIDWRTFVGDEAHRVKDRRAKQTRAAKAIVFGTLGQNPPTRPSRFRYLLSGTPIANNSAEIWSLLNLLDPVAWPAYSRFVDRYATTTWNLFGGMDIGGIKSEFRSEFYQCVDPMTIRRLRQQFDPFKPARVMQTLTVPMEQKQGRAYKEMAESMLAELDGGILVTTSAMVKASRLHQLSQAYGEMQDKGRRDAETGQTMLDLQLKAPSNKVKAMLELVEDMGITSAGLPGQTPVVFGASSRQLIGLCEEALIKAKIPYSIIAGGMSDHEQERNERLFETGQTSVCLCVISAAKEGLNSLVRAPVLVFLQRSWSRIDNEQFTARIDRPGQVAKSVQIIDVVSLGTLEEFDQKEKLEAKGVNFQSVVADERMLRLALEFKGEAF
jgi:SNF2 family DNA or RNA helicase